MAHLSHGSMLNDLGNQNVSEYVKISKIIFECLNSFSQISERMGKIKIDEWAQIQTRDGNNAITNLLMWTAHLNLNVSFQILNNFVCLTRSG